MPLTEKPTEESEIRSQILLLNQELGILQRQAIQLKIPIIILFEGADGAGKGALINKLLLSMDPRGFNVCTFHKPNDEARYRPFLWRYWVETPEKGRITIFDRSWYRHLLEDRVKGLVKKKEVDRYVREITAFERQLSDNKVMVIKVYLTISKKKQKSRFEKLADNPATSWRVTKKDWNRHKHYAEYAKLADEMIQRTHTDTIPWKTIDSTNLKLANLELLQAVTLRIKDFIKAKRTLKLPQINARLNWRKKKISTCKLEQADLTLELDQDEYRTRRNQLQDRLHELEHELYLSRRPVVLVFEGWDAAGKGGAIRRLVKGLDPRGYDVIPIAAPSKQELKHHYMWRFWKQFPKGGHIAIFDRSWYGRVMVERLEGFCSEAEWKRAFNEINETEEHWANCGTIILKFWIHIDKDEQLKRFKAREENSLKQWKITDEDWRNREKWDNYQIAVNDMIDLTDKPNAPWIVVEGNNKPYARIKVLETTVKALEAAL